ncbi:MAG: T9SS type A sorting domain-containing protein, partial [candidate division Zixibacteria bacterium]|nr:T9SS type A sorting domain-containing protein [candidate division Zixibacteria bacterium]
AVPAAATVTATDNCDPGPVVTFSETETAGACAQEKTITRKWVATDACGNADSCLQVITVEDNTPPEITCPDAVSVQCITDVPVPNISLVTATDNCDPGPVVVFVSDVSDNESCPETITRTYMATDACGNWATCTQTITVDDTTPPSITCPDAISVQCPTDVPAPNIGLVTTADNCDPSPVVTHVSDVSDNESCPETITRTYMATDACGNWATCTQTITVDDTTPPSITCPGPVTVECFADVPSPDVGSCSATDNCAPSPVITWVSDNQSGPTQPITIIRTYRATDACGNIDECTQTITVNDVTDPVLTGCPADVTISCEDPIPSPANVTATDNCDGSLSVTMNEVETPGGCPQEKTITRTWTAVDGVGNSASCMQVITIIDNAAPTLVGCPTDVTVECDAVPAAATVTATDNCDPGPVVTFSETETAGACAQEKTITRKWVATDACGNADSCLQVITVEDNTPPVLVGCPANETISCNDPLPSPPSVTATDNCDPSPVVAFSETETPGTCPQEKTITRKWVATDACSNSSECTQIITIVDNTDPVCSVPDDATITLCAPEQICLPVGCTDNCDSYPTMSVVSGPGQISDGQWCYTPSTGTESFTVTVRCEDACGNFCEDAFNVTLVVNSPPVATCPGNISMVLCDLEPVCIPGFECSDVDGNLASCDVNVGTLQGNEVCFTPVEGVNTIELTAEDDCGLTDVCQTTITVTVNDPPICGPIDDINLIACEPQQICADITVSDPDGNFDYCHVIAGPGDISDGQWCYTTGTQDESFNVTIECVDLCGATCQQTFSVSVDVNQPPVVTCPDDAEIPYGQTFTAQATVNDPDEGQVVTFSLGTGSIGTINPNTGYYEVFAAFEDVCDGDVMVIATDECAVADTCSFHICVYNEPPVIDCPNDTVILWGEDLTGTVTAYDPDASPGGLLFSLVDFDGPGNFVVHPNGSFQWNTDPTGEYTGTFTACIAVKDAAPVCDPCSPANADTCCFEINVRAYQLTISKVHGAIQGRDTTVTIWTVISDEIGGFNLLLAYDATALNPTSIQEGQFIKDCGWEYFTYRFGADGNCGSACPSGLLRIVAIAETNNGDNHPSCFGPPDTDEYELVKIKFLVTNDRTFECQYVPIRFIWFECGDNSFSDVTGDTLMISRNIYEYSWDAEYAEWINIADYNDPYAYPTYRGAQDADCFVGNEEKVPFRWIDFRNGGVDIACADSIDARGDINLNEIPYEVADAVLFANYFVYGLSVFTINPDGQIAATDVNADGLTLSVADLVYTIRVVVGDALPYPKVNPVKVNFFNDGGVLSVDDRMGAAYVVVSGRAEPALLVDNMDMKFDYDGQNTRILVYRVERDAAFEGPFLRVEGTVLTVEMALYDGTPVTTKPVPTDYALYQNYPNPFNPTTTFSFNLPAACDYALTIFNVAGQKLAEYTGHGEAGVTTIEWDAGSDQASGVYFYRLTAGNFSATRKMILLK